MAKKKPKVPSNVIVQNKKARHDYFIEERIEAGISLTGWEVKALRVGKVQLIDSFIWFKDGEAYLHNALITPLPTASTHFVTEPNRPRKLLLHKRELSKLERAVEAKGHTCVCTQLYWKNHLVKCEVALAKGKAQHDKRATEKERDWNREKQRTMMKAR